jgi:hypothetical protein
MIKIADKDQDMDQDTDQDQEADGDVEQDLDLDGDQAVLNQSSHLSAEINDHYMDLYKKLIGNK